MTELSASTTSSATVVSVTVTLQSYIVIADPVAYVSQATIYDEILSRAGLDEDLVFISATLQTTQVLGGLYIYTVLVKFSEEDSVTGSHTHDYTTLTFPLRESYRDGPEIDISSTLGPVLITYTDDTEDLLRIRTGTTTPVDRLYVKANGLMRVGSHVEFYADATYDIGTPDAGVTNYRPRDIRLSRDLICGRNVQAGGYADFSSYTKSIYHQFTTQILNPNSSASVRHLYVNATDDSLRYWDGVAENILVPGAIGTDTANLWTCNAAVSVRDVVYWTGPDTVDRATATNIAPGRSALGLCVSKPTATSCYVKHLGELTGFAGSLTAGKRYFVSRTVAGGLTDDPSTLMTGDILQAVGTARTTDTLLILLERPTTL